MKKNFYKLIMLLITCFLLTGCGETKDDYNNAENPENYVRNNFKNFYNKDITLKESKEETDSHNNKIKLMEFVLSEEDTLSFNACSYWEKSSAIPTRHYTSVNNYESKYSTKLLTEYLTEEYGILSKETKQIEYNEICRLDRDILTLELTDIDNLQRLAERLVYIADLKETYALHFKVKYLDKKVNIDINNESSEETYLKELSKLIEE